MTLQTFTNPVWTVETVGGIYIAIILIAIFLAYHLLDSLSVIATDIYRWIKGKKI